MIETVGSRAADPTISLSDEELECVSAKADRLFSYFHGKAGSLLLATYNVRESGTSITDLRNAIADVIVLGRAVINGGTGRWVINYMTLLAMVDFVLSLPDNFMPGTGFLPTDEEIQGLKNAYEASLSS